MSNKMEINDVKRVIIKCVKQNGRIPKPIEVSDAIGLGKNDTIECYISLGFDPLCEKPFPMEKLEDIFGQGIVKFYNYLEEYKNAFYTYPRPCVAIRELNLPKSTVFKYFKILKALGLLDIFKLATRDIDEKTLQIVYQAILEGTLLSRCSPSIKEVAFISGQSLGVVRKAIQKLAEQKKIVWDSNKRRSLSIVEYIEQDSVELIGQSDLKARLLNSYVETLRKYAAIYGNELEEVQDEQQLRIVSGLSQAAFEWVMATIKAGEKGVQL